MLTQQQQAQVAVAVASPRAPGAAAA